MTAEEARQLLAENRARIDSLDRRIVDLLNERTRMAEEIGRAKLTLNAPVLEPRREEDVVRRVMDNNPGPMPDEALRRIYEQIMTEMRALQDMQREPNGK